MGLGLSGQSCLRFLLARGAKVIAMDSRTQLSAQVPEGVSVMLGDFDANVLKSVDLILLSPGLPLSHPAIGEAQAAGVEVIGDIELFARFNQKPLLGITGSNGKSTVTTLTTAMLQSAGLKAVMGGNIGTPALDLLESDYDVAVLELSSFQLETTHNLPLEGATVLNLSADHMDRYDSLEAYRQAKLRIYQHAKTRIANRDDELTQDGSETQTFGLSACEKGFGFDAPSGRLTLDGKPLLDFAQCKLMGRHNLLNIQASLALAMCVTDNLSALVETAYHFTGLAHRCELVREHKGVRWINDSKGTNIGATLAAIEGLRAQVKGKLILIAGGDGKGADFDQLLPGLVQVDELVCLGRDGSKIAALKSASHMVDNMQAAVDKCAALAKPGDLVLLSPACASLDMFDNYQHRGQVFAAAVEGLL
nr:UDP-N-acetylmuramoyl-L-alanine--D-glutamate ligase [Aliiglaciecola sp. CAU 1673]